MSSHHEIHLSETGMSSYFPQHYVLLENDNEGKRNQAENRTHKNCSSFFSKVRDKVDQVSTFLVGNSIISLQDTARGNIRNVVSIVENFTGKQPVVTGIFKTDSALASGLSLITGTLSFQAAVRKLVKASKYGDWLDKIEAVIEVIKSGFSTISSSLGIARYILAFFAITVLSIPSLVLGIVILSIKTLLSLIDLIKIFVTLHRVRTQINKGQNDSEKLQNLVTFFTKVDEKLELKNDKLRGKEYLALKRELASCQDEGRKKEINEKLAVIRETNPDREKFLSARKSSRFVRQLGGSAIGRKAAEYRMVQETLAAIAESESKGKVVDEEKKTEFLRSGMKWSSDIKSLLIKESIWKTAVIGACSLGIIANILLLASFHYSSVIATILSILGSGVWIALDVRGLFDKYYVTSNEKAWAQEVIVDALRKTEWITEANKKEMAAYYGLDPHLSPKALKEALVEKLEQKGIHRSVNFWTVSLLKSCVTQKTLKPWQKKALHSKIETLLLNLAEKKSRKERKDFTKEIRQLPLLEVMRNFDRNRLVALATNQTLDLYRSKLHFQNDFVEQAAG